jgi:hypothetical protein
MAVPFAQGIAPRQLLIARSPMFSNGLRGHLNLFATLLVAVAKS